MEYFSFRKPWNGYSTTVVNVDTHERKEWTDTEDAASVKINQAPYGGVHAFIDKKTGDVFKPASWRGPAKIVRYNLLNPISREDCFNRADWAGGYLYVR